MSESEKPYFGGLWVPVETKNPIPPVLLFLGDCYMIRFRVDPIAKTMDIGSSTYTIEGDRVVYAPTEPEDDQEEPTLSSFKWRFLPQDGRVEFEENGRKSVWEAVRAEDLAAEGFPASIIDKYRSAYAKQGIFYTIEGVVPEPST